MNISISASQAGHMVIYIHDCHIRFDHPASQVLIKKLKEFEGEVPKLVERAITDLFKQWIREEVEHEMYNEFEERDKEGR
jgi:hypothetical protein